MKAETLLRLSLAVAGYFALLFLNGYGFKISSPVFSFFHELLTIPMLILQGALLGISLYKRVIQKDNARPVRIALFLLVITSIVTYGSLTGIIPLT
ncbi:MAG: hypothetical protein LRY55_03660 [Leadbetterella sp.]|nr:hypothetical protein [Leadbetterella sp.]